MSSNPSSRLNAMCCFHSSCSRRISPRSSWTPSARTSCPMAVSVEMTSYSVRHGADVMSVPSSILSGGIRCRCTSATMRSFVTMSSQRDSMTSAMQVVHRLHRQEHHEVDPRFFLGLGQPKIQLTAPLDDFLEQLFDRVLVAVGEAGDAAAHVFANATDEFGR